MTAEDGPFQFEDIPLEEARLMGRAPRMEPLLYDTLRKKIQALRSEATRVRLGPEITQRRMRNYILRIAHELGVPVMVRRVAGGVIFWRATEEERQQAQEMARRLQNARQHRSTQSKGRQLRRTRPGRGRRGS
jgi:hypothetical protein